MRRAFILLIVFLIAAAVHAQTPETGAIVGRVIDRDAVVAGAKVEARSPSMPGGRIETTDETGSFRFRLLPPGQYTVTVSLIGFGTVRQRDITVRLGHTVSITVPLQQTMSAEVTVTRDAPLVDVTSTVSGINITTEVAAALPLARSYAAAANIAPGTRPDDVGPAIYGSTGAENQFVIDGLNVTDLAAGISNKDVSVDFVQELEVVTGGLPAEYGRTTGGLIRAVTKSGSNDFKGDVFGYASSRNMFARKKSLADHNPEYVWWVRADALNDVGIDAGGPIVRDRLWAFAAYDRTTQQNGNVYIDDWIVQGFSVPAGGEVATVTRQDLQSMKLTLALTPRQTLTASMFGDPGSWRGMVHQALGPPSTWYGDRRQGADDYVGRYSGIFAAKVDVNGLAGRNTEVSRTVGMNATTPLLVDNTVSPGQRSGGFGAYSNGKGTRDVLKADSTMFLFGGRHAIKVGADQERQFQTWSDFFSGGARVQKLCSVALVNKHCPDNKIYYQHTSWVNDLSPTFNAKDASTWAANFVNPLVTRYMTLNRSFYVQDSWTLQSLTINAGFRVERQRLTDRRNGTQLELNNPAPRLGVVWDPRGDGRSRIYGYYGRYYESIPMEMDGYFGGLPQVMVRNLSPDPANFTPDPGAPAYANKTQSYLAAAAYGVTIDPNVRGQYLDEYLLGYDRQFGSNFTAGIKASFRNMPLILEDVTIDPNDGVIIANPGRGMASKISFVNGELITPPAAVRRNTALELHASRRFSGNSQFFASYVWSRLYGNYEGLYQASTGQLGPNIDANWDFADFLINSYGPLPADRTHQLKAYGSYQIPKGFARGLTIGADAHWYSGAPLAAKGLDYYWYTQTYLTTPGSLGRGPADYEADLHLGYPIEARGARLEILFDVMNVLNRQGATLLDQMYNTYADGPCGGVPQNICDADTGALLHKPGTITPIAALTNPRATATNTHFLHGDAWTAPRQIRFGARVRF